MNTQIKNIHCSIVAGVNICGICYNEANFSTSIPQKKHKDLPNMEIFCCGHGMCEDCYENMMKKTSQFNCPFCRKQGLTIANFDYAVSLSLQTRGCLNSNESLPSPIKITNTLSEYLEEWEWENKTQLLYSSNNLFMILLKQIIINEKNKKKKLAEYKRRNDIIKQKELVKKSRKESREKAVCKYCQKNTFTSMKQLEIHIKSKHK